MSDDTTDLDPDEPADEPSVPTDDGPPYTCPYCGRELAHASWLALHEGLEHGTVLDADEREAFEAAYEDEEAALRLFRLKALAALVVVYFGFIIAFAFF